MSNRCPRPLAVFVATVCLSIPAWSQYSENATLKGELRSEIPVSFPDYWVELADLGRSNNTRRVDVQPDGSFQIRDSPNGDYMLRVTNNQGDLVHQEMVSVGPHTGPLIVTLPGRAKEHSAPGTISVTQLNHPPAKKAIQAAVSAQRFAASGQTEKAAEELEKAIRISPEYADAYNNLGVQYLRMGRFEQACGEFTRAISIAGPSAPVLSNLAWAQRRLGRNAEANASARAALRLDAGSAPAHLILGTILAEDRRTRAESIAHLQRAAETMPAAKDALEKVRAAP